MKKTLRSLIQLVGCSRDKAFDYHRFKSRRICFFILCSIFFIGNSFGQRFNPDSLKQLLQNDMPDTSRMKLYWLVTQAIFFTQPDSSLLYSTEGVKLARKIGDTDNEIKMLNFIGEAYRLLGDFPASLRVQFECLKLSQDVKNKRGEADCLGFIGITYVDFGDYIRGLQYLFPSLKMQRSISQKIKIGLNLTVIGSAYDFLDMQDSALYYQQIALDSSRAVNPKIMATAAWGPLRSLIFTRLGNAYARSGNDDSAMYYYDRGLENCIATNEKVNVGRLQGKKASLFFRQGKYDSAMLYARKAYSSNIRSNQRPEQMDMGLLLSRLYRTSNQYDSALFYQDLAMAMNDSLYGAKKFKNLQTLLIDEQERKQKIEQEQLVYKSRIRYGALIAGMIGLLFVSSILFRKNKHKQKANLQLVKENKEAQLQLLKAQIHPHFLFNTLNNIYSQAQKESPESADMIMELAHILRYMLDETKHELVPLESELQLITDYINLEKMRYGEGLDLYISFPSNTADLYITPLMLLPFVENCFKHGTSKVLHNPWINFKIELEENMLSLKLMNGKNPSKTVTSKRKGTGIENARRRLELLYPDNYEMQVIEEDDVFIVNLKMKMVSGDAVTADRKREIQNYVYVQ